MDDTMQARRKTRPGGDGSDRESRPIRCRSATRRGVGMDQLREFLKVVRDLGAARGTLLGFIHALIGRRIATADGTLVSAGMAWRALATVLKRERWEPEAVRELGLDPNALPPRDRYRFWYSVINKARV